MMFSRWLTMLLGLLPAGRCLCIPCRAGSKQYAWGAFIINRHSQRQRGWQTVRICVRGCPEIVRPTGENQPIKIHHLNSLARNRDSERTQRHVSSPEKHVHGADQFSSHTLGPFHKVSEQAGASTSRSIFDLGPASIMQCAKNPLRHDQTRLYFSKTLIIRLL
ncbi:hypothetical protein BD289DRAFT_154052 [Coniella lustricola]|uniref:Secreted protein n=1 Tax=Coniella lustricola TaxID=2025994 RepID=A0A2T3AMB2_9PEZI|nr:hypothetical protein BD289DRAFT_154052 [Coniella lustricola]